jgi:uridine kinase
MKEKEYNMKNNSKKKYAYIVGVFFYCTTLYSVDYIDNASLINAIVVPAQQLAFEHMQHRAMPIPVLAIAGCSAVGKTFFSQMIAHELRHRGVNVLLFHQDDFLNKERTYAGFKIHPNLDHEAMHLFLSRNQAGEKVIGKPCLVKSDRLKYKLLNLEKIDLIIFEGIYALTGPETYDFVRYSTMRVFLDSSTHNIVAWHAARNKKRSFFKRLGSSEIRQHAECLLYEYAMFINPSKKNADVIVYKDAINSYRLVDQ